MEERERNEIARENERKAKSARAAGVQLEALEAEEDSLRGASSGAVDASDESAFNQFNIKGRGKGASWLMAARWHARQGWYVHTYIRTVAVIGLLKNNNVITIRLCTYINLLLFVSIGFECVSL